MTDDEAAKTAELLLLNKTAEITKIKICRIFCLLMDLGICNTEAIIDENKNIKSMHYILLTNLIENTLLKITISDSNGLITDLSL